MIVLICVYWIGYVFTYYYFRKFVKTEYPTLAWTYGDVLFNFAFCFIWPIPLIIVFIKKLSKRSEPPTWM